MDIIGERPGARNAKKRKDADAKVWIDVGLKLGGLVAVFAGMAGAFMVLLSSRSYP